MKLERIGKYEILGEIGRGTMGTVYKAKDPVLNRFVAIKTMVATPGRNDESKQRFQREAQAAALLSHPNIVTMHDLGEEQGLIYMAMELLEGEDLRDVIGTERVASLDEQLHVMEQIGAGLSFAHSKGVVHRDLKPANIHLQPNGQIKILDFGLARLGGSDMTQTGVVLGTPNYMSPEQALGDRVDARTDVFSAGGVFYELLTGRKPFDAETTPGVLYQVVHKEPVAIRKWTPEVPPILVEVVERCLAKDKTLRFQNGRQMRAALGVVRQAMEGGRAETATLAEESQRAHEEARKDSSLRGISPAGSKPPWVEGNVALDPGPAPATHSSGPRAATTLSGRASTEPQGRRAPPPPAKRPLGWLVGGFVLLLGAAGAGYWYWTRPPGPTAVVPAPSPAPSATPGGEVTALTEALVDSQMELAFKNLEDKNWSGAIAQAERVLRLRPDSEQAMQILEQARGRRGELDAAASEARRAFEAGNFQEASAALDRVLELDPKHPVVGELTARLNSSFSTRAEEARKLAQRARGEAEKTKATTQDAFSEALARTAEGDVLFRKSEFAEATQRFLEARDAFDRARRTALASARPAPATPPPVADRPAVQPTASAAAPAPPPATVVAPPTAAALPLRRFVTGKSVVGSAKSGGSLAGFDDVKTRKVPDLVGHLEFEVTPEAPQEGESYGVRVYMVNDGRRSIRLRGVALANIVNGRRTVLPATMREKEVLPQQRALVTETRGTWPGGLTSWTLEAILSSDHDETCTSRLEWQ